MKLRVIARWLLTAVGALVGLLLLLLLIWRFWQPESSTQILRLRQWLATPQAYPTWSIAGGARCGNALMVLPSTGYVGFGWDDSFRPGHRHSGLDIFGPDPANNLTPIVAAYDGYLTREADWKSTVIIRHPDFPALPAAGIAAGAEIWTYYTHMASRDGTESYVAPAFPPGTHEQFVKAGTLLGRQGNWGGSPWQLTGRHLHFSVVKPKPTGGYADEREIAHTYDPLPLLGLQKDRDGFIRCAVVGGS